jgi:Transposase DDE domain/Domain of unknown function (DUF4372)
MRHHNSVLHDLLKHIAWGRFEALVEKHRADHSVRRLSSKSQLVALLHAQLCGAASLREIVATLHSHQNRLYHLGVAAPKRSTLADANAKRPAALFGDVFAMLLAGAHPALRRHAREAVSLIDATHIPLGALAKGWAHAGRASGAKMHTVLDAATGLPVHFDVTTARVNDITVARSLTIPPRQTVVFDLGYYDFGWWRALHDAGCRFVTRLKGNTRPLAVETRAVEPGGAVTADRVVRMSWRMTANRRNPLADVPLREIEVVLQTGKRLRIVCNDLEAPATEIAELYKTRWQIELFFRWVKQNLKMRRFLGTSENAIRIQIAVALIAYLLLRLAHAAQSSVDGLLAFTRLIKANLMHRRSIDNLADPPPHIRPDPRQALLPI